MVRSLLCTGLRVNHHRPTGCDQTVHTRRRDANALLPTRHFQSMELGSIQQTTEDVLHLLANDARTIVHNGHSVARTLRGCEPLRLKILDDHRDLGQDPALFACIKRVVDRFLHGGQQRLTRIVEPEQMPVLDEELADRDFFLPRRHFFGSGTTARLRRLSVSFLHFALHRWILRAVRRPTSYPTVTEDRSLRAHPCEFPRIRPSCTNWVTLSPLPSTPNTRNHAMETTLIILKPDAVQRGLMGRIISRFEDKGLQVVGAKLMQISPELAATHYKDHQGKGFYNGLVGFMTSSPVLVLAIRGIGSITICRGMMGATFGSKAAAGTIRGDFGVSNSFNLIHGSDSPEAAERELGLFFKAGEVLDFPRASDRWVYDSSSGKAE